MHGYQLGKSVGTVLIPIGGQVFMLEGGGGKMALPTPLFLGMSLQDVF